MRKSFLRAIKRAAAELPSDDSLCRGKRVGKLSLRTELTVNPLESSGSGLSGRAGPTVTGTLELTKSRGEAVQAPVTAPPCVCEYLYNIPSQQQTNQEVGQPPQSQSYVQYHRQTRIPSGKYHRTHSPIGQTEIAAQIQEAAKGQKKFHGKRQWSRSPQISYTACRPQRSNRKVTLVEQNWDERGLPRHLAAPKSMHPPTH